MTTDNLPRRIRRGLIEAASLSSTVSTSASFRGEFAAASLKRPLWSGYEAEKRPFRGEFAAASLKRFQFLRRCLT